MGTVGVAILGSLFGLVRFSLGSLGDVLKTAFSLLLCYLGVAVISFLANLIRTPAVLERELKTKLEGEISELREQIVKLNKKPYDEALKKEVADLLAKLPAEAERVLKFLLPRGEMQEYIVVKALENEVQDVKSILSKALELGLLKFRREERSFMVGVHPIINSVTYYWIPEKFTPVLRELL